MFSNSEIYIYNYEEFKTDYTQCLNFLSGVEKYNNKFVNTKKLKSGMYEMKIKPKYIEKIYNMSPKIIKRFQNIYVIKIFWNILKKLLYKKVIFNSIDNKTIEKINKKFEWDKK